MFAFAQQKRKTIHHYNVPGDAHFLTFSCFHGLPLLSNDRIRIALVQSISKARVEHSFDLWAWVFMLEHVHLLLWPRQEDYDIAKILWSIKQPAAAKEIEYLRRHDPDVFARITVRNRNREYHRFWQAGPGDDHNLYEPRAVHAAIDYTHENPRRRGLVAKPEDWVWSSARDWAGRGAVYLPVDRTVPMLQSSDC